MMNAYRGLVLALSMALVLAAGVPAHAYEQPQINLGFTTFLDGAPPAGPGLYFQEYLQYRDVQQFNGPDGEEVTTPGGDPVSPDMGVWISLNQFIYQSNQELLLGAKWGVEFIVPVVYLDLDETNMMGLTEATPALGDLWIGGFLQWDPIMGDNGPIFVHRFELQGILSTGKYDKNSVLNGGANHFSINPYWAGTLWLHPRLTTSWRIHYLWNDKNTHTDVKAGDAIHSNFAAAYEVLPQQLRVGVNAYHLHQLEEDKASGVKVTDSKEQVIAVGPGAVYHFSPHDHLFLNVYFETEVENRPESNIFQLRWTHHFQ